MTCSPYASELPARAKIVNAYAAHHARAAERHLRFATARLGLRLSPGARILDFGCGIGDSVRGLLEQGYDAFGVDVLEYWGRDFDKYWHVAERPSAEVARRLKVVGCRSRTARSTFASAIKSSSMFSITRPPCRRSSACSNRERFRCIIFPARTI
jgi:SAM-dependent methyltransferase